MKSPIPDQLALPNETKEEQYVHQIYDEISTHFSNTRYKPWPVVEDFINSLEVGSIGADVGCGNGKYMGLRKGEIYFSGSDYSGGLLEIATSRGHDCMISDCLYLPYRSSLLDFAISIAVIHHLSSYERRRKAILELERIIKPGGKILVFVWALEQSSKRNFDPNLQDVLVPWVMKNNQKKSQKPKPPKSKKPSKSHTSHLESTNLENLDSNKPSNISNSSQYVNIDTHISETAQYTAENTQDNPPESVKDLETDDDSEKVYYRYYHLFKQGELVDLVQNIPSLEIIQSGYDKDNWFVVLKKLET
ncbi:hypothetical protein BB560_006910 [Smittium megazygosporum]|uniref:Methyltransferase type 11 domain-containing protein n=1 Tax=Smittium megazygosporum TaxID=133381 RepID=A0A2T9Y0D5_9FUNG|nr:hypothetical protein BB560_006910 [Smittium megazygosporum]